MERQEECIRTVSSLVQSVNTQVSDSSKRIANLETVTKALTPDETYDLSSSETNATKRELSLEEEEEYIIQALERQRLERVMDLQNLEYVHSNLVELIDLNDDILQSVKEYLEQKGDARLKDKQLGDQNLQHYIDDLIEPTISVLDANLVDLQSGIRDIELRFNGLIESLQDDQQKMPVYQEKINEMIRIINDLCNK